MNVSAHTYSPTYANGKPSIKEDTLKVSQIKSTDVLTNVQNGKKIVCVDFGIEAYYDCKTMTVGALQERIADPASLFFVLEK